MKPDGQKSGFDTGPVLTMEPCITCGEPWEMRESEKLWWEAGMVKSNLVFPKRCKKCRGEKKKKKLSEIPKELRELAGKVSEGEFAGKQDELGQRMEELAVRLEQARA